MHDILNSSWQCTRKSS